MQKQIHPKQEKELQQELTIKLMQILEHWKLSDDEKIAVLRLENIIKSRHLYRYQRGENVFKLTNCFVDISQMVIGIDDSLKTSYPTNQNYGQIWLRRSQKKFKGETPLMLMLRDKAGMRRVWHFLDCTQSWQ